MNKSASRPKLLSLDDDEQIGAIILAVAEQAGFDGTAVSAPETFQASLAQNAPDVILLDLQIPGCDGIQLLRALGDENVTCRIVFVTGMDTRTIASAQQFAVKRGLDVFATLQKPFTPEELLQTLLAAKALTQPLDADDLAGAIRNSELAVYYQPVLKRFADGWDIDSVEALLRWEHPERGTLTPRHFLELGDGDLMRQMTDFVIREGLQQIRGWYASKLQLGLRVNLSATLLTDIEFPDRLEVAMREHDIGGSSLIIEVNETGMLDEHPETYDILTRLRLKEVRLAIDDFGIGYSSLTQLFRMPFCEMKIDRSLIAAVPGSPEARTTVEALVDLAHKLGLEVCGEGVETDEVLGFLTAAGCDAAQGFLVSQPVVPKTIPEIIHAWQLRRANSAAAQEAVR